MTALLEDRVTAYVADHPNRSAEDVALALRARVQTVREILSSPFFECTVGAKRAKVYRLATVPRATGRAGTGETHKARVLRLLSDGRPHGHLEGYRLGVMLHSRVADLRRDGYRIRCWREGDDYLYQLVPLDEVTGGMDSLPATEAPTPASASVASSSGAVQDPPGTGGGRAAQLVLTGPEFRKRAAA